MPHDSVSSDQLCSLALAWRRALTCSFAVLGACSARTRRGLRLALIRPIRPGETAPLIALQKEAVRTFAAEPAKADKLIKAARATSPAGMSKAEFASWIVTANAILNLDEFLSRN